MLNLIWCAYAAAASYNYYAEDADVPSSATALGNEDSLYDGCKICLSNLKSPWSLILTLLHLFCALGWTGTAVSGYRYGQPDWGWLIMSPLLHLQTCLLPWWGQSEVTNGVQVAQVKETEVTWWNNLITGYKYWYRAVVRSPGTAHAW